MDDDPVGPAAYPDNWAPSALRARTVLTILTDNGVPPANIAVVGYGEHRPVADNDTPEGSRKSKDGDRPGPTTGATLNAA